MCRNHSLACLWYSSTVVEQSGAVDGNSPEQLIACRVFLSLSVEWCLESHQGVKSVAKQPFFTAICQRIHCLLKGSQCVPPWGCSSGGNQRMNRASAPLPVYVIQRSTYLSRNSWSIHQPSNHVGVQFNHCTTIGVHHDPVSGNGLSTQRETINSINRRTYGSLQSFDFAK